MALAADPAVAEAVERGLDEISYKSFQIHRRTGNVVVFFDVTIGGVAAGRMKVFFFSWRVKSWSWSFSLSSSKMWSQEQWKTFGNFAQVGDVDYSAVASHHELGEFTRSNQPVGYKNCPFHRIIKEFMIQVVVMLMLHTSPSFTSFSGGRFSQARRNWAPLNLWRSF